MTKYNMINTKQLENLSKEELMEKYNDAVETIWFLDKQLRDSNKNNELLFEDYDTASGDLQFLSSRCNQLEEELRYMRDFTIGCT